MPDVEARPHGVHRHYHLHKMYNKGQLEHLWVLAGGKRSAAPVAAAVALAESSGDPNNSNYNTNGTTDRGLWQINSVHGALSTFQPLANARAAVKISNNGTNWSPWTTYTEGTYTKYLGASQLGSPSAKLSQTQLAGLFPGVPFGPEVNPLGPLEKGKELGEGLLGKANPLEGAKSALELPLNILKGFTSALKDFVKVFGFVKGITEFLSSGSGWTRIAKVVGGGVIIIIALSELAKAGTGSSGQNVAVTGARNARQGARKVAEGAIAAAVAEPVK